MENQNKHDRQNPDNGQKMNFTGDNKHLNKDQKQVPKPDGDLPEDDPALINPDELASFPKEMNDTDPDIDNERESHLTNRKSSPLREGRNITRTDTTPDNDGGFM